VVIILNKEEATVTVRVMLILCNSISPLVNPELMLCRDEDKHKTTKHTLNISMLTTPGPFPLIMLVSSSSLSPLGTFPINSLCFACDKEHRKVLPCSTKNHRI